MSHLMQSLVLGGVRGSPLSKGLIGLDFSIFLNFMKRKGLSILVIIPSQKSIE